MGSILSSLFIGVPQVPCTIAKYDKLPVPKCTHMVLTDEHVGNRDIIIVGDVHGCLEELQELIRLTESKYGTDCLYIFVGDVVNKGPKNVETLHFVQKLNNAYVVRGNHEERVIKEWIDLKSGRIPAFTEKYTWMEDLSDSDIEYIMELPYTITVPSKLITVVHAGMSPWRHLNSQLPLHMVTMRNIVGIDTIEPQETEKTHSGVPWASVWPGPEHVYFGHDARRRLQIHQHATGLDTGCVYGGSLTAVNASLPGTVVMSVPAKRVYRAH